MRAHTTPRQTISRRIAAGFAVVLLTSIFAMNATSLQAQDPDSDPGIDPGLTDSGGVELVEFNAISMGFDNWFVDGLVRSSDMAATSISLGGAAIGVGAISPDEFGYFSFKLVAVPNDSVTAAATDGTSTSSATLTLEDWDDDAI